jgi:glycine betaine/choline ABC-type transport system substrate-binding protein
MDKKIAVAGVVLLVIAGAVAFLSLSGPGGADVVVGSKHFTEQKILGEIAAQLIEAKTGLTVERKLGLQGTKVCFSALREGDLDLYPEYTGTGLVNLLEEPYDAAMSRSEIQKHVADEFVKRWGIVWLEPLGFANTYAYAMRAKQAEELGVKKISDLKAHAAEVRPGFDHEYTMRPEFKRFEDVYGFALEKDVTRLDPDITYKALKDGEVDLIDAFSTDGRIAAYGLVVLEDDGRLFPPYDACLTVRKETLDRHPALGDVLRLLSGRISPAEMQKMNYAVSEELRSPASVAREFLQNEGLLPGQAE